MANGAGYLDAGPLSGIADRPRFYTKLRGVSFDDRQIHVQSLREGQTLSLLREPNNPADPNAICCLTENGEKLGYLSRQIASQLAPSLTSAHPIMQKLRRSPERKRRRAASTSSS